MVRTATTPGQSTLYFYSPKGCSMERKSVVLEDLLDDVAPTTNTTTELGIVITIAVVIL